MAAYISFQPSDFFSPKLYTGNSSSAEIPVTGVGFQPDFVWAKNRDATYDHFLFDSVRGATKYWRSNEQAVEGTNAQTLKSFDSDGYTMGTDSDVNQSTSGFASWSWKMGTTSGIAGSPSITPTGYSFDATSGFSIIAYTGNGTSGATLPHGLGVAPDLITVKCLSHTGSWPVYHTSLGATKYLELNQNSDVQTGTSRWNDTAPTSTLFSLGNTANVNENLRTYVAYCFTEKIGYSKIAEYWGNGQTSDGTFVYTGFRPSFILMKRTSGGTGNRKIFDDKRLGYNGGNSYLSPNDDGAENTGGQIDIVSNGFKMRNSGTYTNASGDTYMYAAFAKFPIVSSNDVPTVAR